MRLDWTLSLLVVATPAVAYTTNEQQYLPMLQTELHTHWSDIRPRAPFAAQIRQETCPSLKSAKCYNPRAELKTSLEYGFGLGQLTVTKRFDNFKEARKLHPTLSNWEWENRYNAAFQLRTMVLMDKHAYSRFAFAANSTERMGFMFAGYNGGVGGVLSDRTVCKATPGCDPAYWFGHVERTSKKAKTVHSGYGKSFFEINREYVRHILIDYPERYRPFFGE